MRGLVEGASNDIATLSGFPPQAAVRFDLLSTQTLPSPGFPGWSHSLTVDRLASRLPKAARSEQR